MTGTTTNDAAERAMDRIRDEMAKAAKTQPGVVVIGEYMTGRLRKEPGIAEKVLDEKKTLAEAFRKIRKYAEEHRTGNFAVVDDRTAYGIVDQYYGIDGGTSSVTPDGVPPSPEGKAFGAQTPADDGLDLDALLGV